MSLGFWDLLIETSPYTPSNALAETINGLYKAEVIRRNGPWRNTEEVEFATLEWVDWFNLFTARKYRPRGPDSRNGVVCPGFRGVG